MAKVSVDSVRFGDQAGKIRMVIDLDQKTNFRTFMLSNIDDKPYRIVVDLPTFDWKANKISKPKGNHVLDVRSGNLQPDISRIVIDLAYPAKIEKAFTLPKASGKSDRLVIDFKKTPVDEFKTSHTKIFGTLSEKNISKTTVAKKAATPTIAPTTPKVPVTPLYKPLVIIDAGHGGKDSGAVGHGRIYEKNITLYTARILKKELEATGKYRVQLTRDKDKYIKLRSRVAYARKKEGDLFISIHADSIDNPSVRGASIYTLSNTASDKQTARLAKRENQVDLIAGVDLSHEDKDVANILIDLAMRDTMNQSKFFANTVVGQFKANKIKVLTRPHRYAGFAVLKAPDIPSVLIEIGFMSNKSEVNLLSTDSYRQKMAGAIANSVDKYFTKVRKNQSQ